MLSEQEQQRLVLRVARDVVGEREPEDERGHRPDERELERLEEDVAVEVEVPREVVPQVAVVVERPRVRRNERPRVPLSTGRQQRVHDVRRVGRRPHFQRFPAAALQRPVQVIQGPVER